LVAHLSQYGGVKVKLLVIGCGQCGGRVADEFRRLSVGSRVQRGLDIITDAIAVNTDVADLSGLSHIKPDCQHRILIGGQKTGGHGVGKINELGAEVAGEDSDKIIESLRAAERFSETDAILLIAGAAGGTGSGSMPILTQQLKERYTDKPVYNLVVLPFRYEELNEERSIYNVGTCLKSAYLVADAVFLVDNQRYVRKNISIKNNLAKINTLVVRPFYNLLCAGEETNPKYVGSRVLDAGDIIQTLAGWTVIGYCKTQLPRIRFRGEGKLHFRAKVTETQKGTQAMEQAIGELSVKCNATDARRALYLLTAPPGEMNMDMIKELSTSLKNVATEAIVRSGDYPRGKDSVDVTVILSDLINSKRVTGYFKKTIDYISSAKRRQHGTDQEHMTIEETFRDIPSLV
jgi:cell division GTPase FtsZ